MWVCLYPCGYLLQPEERSLDCLELELQAIVSHLPRVLGKNVGPLGRSASALKVIHFSRLCGVLLTPFSEAFGTLTGRKMAIQGYSAENSKTWSQGLGERFGSDRAYPAAGDFDGHRGQQ